jgi:hypothetical protein
MHDELLTQSVKGKKTMFAGQVNWVNPSDLAGRAEAQKGLFDGRDSEVEFALVYETVLGLSDEQSFELGASGNLLETNAEDDPMDAYGSSRMRDALNRDFGAGKSYFSSKDPNAELGLGYFEPQYTGSSMSRLMSQGSGSQIAPVQSRDAKLTAKAAETGALKNGDLGHFAEPDGTFPQTSPSDGVLNKSLLSSWMDAHALSRSSHHCATYCRLGMEAAGLNTGDRPQTGDAGDYGPFLVRHGAQTVPQDSYVPQVGDVVVFNKTEQHPYGHIEMYDGHQWVSDFMQHSFSPYRDAVSTPPFTIYRMT